MSNDNLPPLAFGADNLARLLVNLEDTSTNEGSDALACRLSDCRTVIHELLIDRAQRDAVAASGAGVPVTPWNVRMGVEVGALVPIEAAFPHMKAEIIELRAALAAAPTPDRATKAEAPKPDHLHDAAAPAAPTRKDHDVREFVNGLRDIANRFHGAGQLRERIAYAVQDFLAIPAPAAPIAEEAGEQYFADVNCNEDRRRAGTSYPRTCAKCGLGPCKRLSPWLTWQSRDQKADEGGGNPV